MDQKNEALDANYATSGFNARLGFGKSPAVLLIDLAEAYFREGSPLYHPRFQPAAESCIRLQEAAHAAGVPVILTRVEIDKGGRDAGIFFKKSKVPLLCFNPGNPLADLIPSLKVAPSDIIVTKRYASSFFGTHLAAMLTSMGIDTLIMGGVSTSGCVRATALDTCQHGFRPIVVEEACGDRHPEPHNSNLFDINAKYGDVVREKEALDYLATFASAN